MLSFLCTHICPSLSSMHIRVFGHLSIYLSMFLDVSLRFVPSASLCVLLPAYFLLCAYVWLFRYITSLPLDFVFFVRLLYTLSEFIHSFILNIYIAPLQGNYSEANDALSPLISVFSASVTSPR